MGSIGTKSLKILREFCPIDVQKVGIKELVRLVIPLHHCCREQLLQMGKAKSMAL